MTAQTTGKNPMVELPCNIILTSKGMNLMGGNPAVKQVKNRDGLPKEGLSSSSYHAQTVQKLVMKACIEEISCSLPELLSRRQAIISTNNLIVYAILYKKLSPALARTLFDSSIVKEFNRRNPKHAITDLGQIPESKVQMLENEYKKVFEGMKDGIHRAVLGSIIQNPGLSDEDREARVRSLPKFINWIDTRIWFVYFILYQSSLKNMVERTFAGMIYRYLDHTRIATHLSNLLMEFVQNAEKAHLERLAVKGQMGSQGGVDHILRDLETRTKLIQLASKRKQFLELSWVMNPERVTVGHTNRIQITISNYGLISEDNSQKLSKKMKTNTDGISLANFYESEDGSEAKLGAGLGLLYNSYLEDICKEEGILYRCNIFPEPRKEKTTVKVDMTL